MQAAPIYYSFREIPDRAESIAELDLTITWETEFDVSGGMLNPDIRNEDMNTLLNRRVAEILKERGGDCVHMKHEKITHSISYGHGTHIITGEYQVVLYRVNKI
jgi:hypothetical protein